MVCVFVLLGLFVTGRQGVQTWEGFEEGHGVWYPEYACQFNGSNIEELVWNAIVSSFMRYDS